MKLVPQCRNPYKKKLQHFETLEFENVYFRYTEDGPYVLNGISFKIQKGHQIALVGATGSGKSTIIRLLTRMYTQYEGSIRINGIELSHISHKILQQMIALLQQETYLFEESIAFNIVLNRKGIDQKKIEKSAAYVYANTFIETFPDQYAHQLLGNGQNLSEGQVRLIAFARAIAGESEMIVLDEATSSVDSVTESYIQKAIERIFQEKTVIAIAHRLSTIRNSQPHPRHARRADPRARES